MWSKAHLHTDRRLLSSAAKIGAFSVSLVLLLVACAGSETRGGTVVSANSIQLCIRLDIDTPPKANPEYRRCVNWDSDALEGKIEDYAVGECVDVTLAPESSDILSVTKRLCPEASDA